MVLWFYSPPYPPFPSYPLLLLTSGPLAVEEEKDGWIKVHNAMTRWVDEQTGNKEKDRGETVRRTKGKKQEDEGLNGQRERSRKSRNSDQRCRD